MSDATGGGAVDLGKAELDAKLKAEMDAVADGQIAQQRANDLKQKVKDIEAAKSNAEKAFANAQAHANAAFASRTPNTTPSFNVQSKSPPPSNPQSNPTPPSSSSQNTKPSTKSSPKQTLLPKPPKPTSRFPSSNAALEPTSSLRMQRQLEEHSGGQVLDFLAEMENQVGTLIFILAGYNK
ncbi:hypothetical protein M405DRAFT_870111 [Rhizopogon salebrosus TDB-379]|nr:hypothetical protein M405DRAFT_870111 [Rhizopogon salebrosus TDB-379]